MVRVMMLVFALLTASAAAMTYYNVGLESTTYTDNSARSGSARLYGASGGYSHGK